VLSVRPFIEPDRERWDDYVRRTPGSHPGQLTAWKTLVEEQYGCRGYYLIAEEGSRIRGILPLFEKRQLGRAHSWFSAPGGLLADDEAIASALLAPAVETVRRERLAFLELRDQPRAWPGLVGSDEHCTVVLDLPSDVESLWTRYDGKLRNQIRKAERSGFAVRWGEDQLPAFHRVMLENMRDLGTPLHGVGFFRRAFDCLRPSAEIVVIELGGEPVGGMFLVTHGRTMLDLWASSLRRHFASCPNQMLYAEALRRAVARGLERFDFGRSQWNSRTFRFKVQWGARPRPLHYQYVLGTATHIPTLGDQRRLYAAVVAGWKRLPLPAARLIGPPVRRRFPELM